MTRRVFPDRPLTRAEIKLRMRAKRVSNGIPLITELEQARARIRQLEWRARQTDTGGCMQCKAPATHGLRCEYHWLTMFVHAHRMSPTRACAEMLRQIWTEQGGKCALTGIQMEIGGGGKSRTPLVASVDHKIPKAAGGTNSKENLQWVCFAVNAAKADMSQADFIALCRKVSAHEDARVVPIRKV